ncbi:carboxypeptidase regulatory-like domain-containing protein [Planctomycetota bacterium]
MSDLKSFPEQLVAYSQASEAMGLLTLDESHREGDIHFVLKYKDGTLKGRVVDKVGKAVKGRGVEMIFTTSEGHRYHSRVNKTDKNGYYAFGRVPGGESVTVQVRLIEEDPDITKQITAPLALSKKQILYEIPPVVIGGAKQQPDFDQNFPNDGHVQISGQVVNEQNEPITYARVIIYYQMEGYMATHVSEVMTDAEGRWHCRIPQEHSRLSIRLIHPEYISFHFDQSSRTPALTDLINGSNVMVMKKGLHISGKVLDSEGKPIVNALVAAGRLYSSMSGQITEDPTTARTGADGSFGIGGLPRDKIDMTLSAVGFAPQIIPIEIQPDIEPLSLILNKGKVYKGQVVDKEGNLLEGVRIICQDWKFDNQRERLARFGQTDEQGNFQIEDIPETGTLSFRFSKKGFLGMSKDTPDDLAQTDQLTLYKTPIIAGKVIDAETEEPITRFEVMCGIQSASFGDTLTWSRYYKYTKNSSDGTFRQAWGGYGVSYPFEGSCHLQIIAAGYYPQATPPVKLGEVYEPFVIRLEKAESITGTLLAPDGSPAGQAQIALVRPGEIAFVSEGRFDSTGFVSQVEFIKKTNTEGEFTLTPSKEPGLIVAMHPVGYAEIKSEEFENGSALQLTGWARIEGTIRLPETQDKSVTLRIQTMQGRPPEIPAPRIDWMFGNTTFSEDKFVFEHIPCLPLQVGRVVRGLLSDAVELDCEPGKTYVITIGGSRRTVSGKILWPRDNSLPAKDIPDFIDTRRVHAAAYRINPGIKVISQNYPQDSDFLWLWLDAGKAYERSTTFQRQFIPEISSDGNFHFTNLLPGDYEFLVNVHSPLRPST